MVLNIVWVDVDGINLTQERVQWQAFVDTVKTLVFKKIREFIG